jgi:hypothetical protein
LKVGARKSEHQRKTGNRRNTERNIHFTTRAILSRSRKLRGADQNKFVSQGRLAKMAKKATKKAAKKGKKKVAKKAAKKRM